MKIPSVFFISVMVLLCWSAYAQDPRIELTPAQLACLEKLIYFNECSGRTENLVSWRNDEAFPSFGIAHFIWYPAEKQGPYKETFPEFLLFVEQNKAEIPAWIKEMPVLACPWSDQAKFRADLQSERMLLLRSFLDRTRDLQAAFIVQRMEKAFSKILEVVPEDQRPMIEKKLRLVEASPNGIFALIDYVNFKGEGILETERFKGRGWGLLQVLQEMKVPKDPSGALTEFVNAAQAVLEKRVQNSAISDVELKRLQGWKNRVLRYLNVTC